MLEQKEKQRSNWWLVEIDGVNHHWRVLLRGLDESFEMNTLRWIFSLLSFLQEVVLSCQLSLYWAGCPWGWWNGRCGYGRGKKKGGNLLPLTLQRNFRWFLLKWLEFILGLLFRSSLISFSSKKEGSSLACLPRSRWLNVELKCLSRESVSMYAFPGWCLKHSIFSSNKWKLWNSK